MRTTVYLPFLLTGALVVLGRLGSDRLSPRIGAWTLACCTAVVAVSSAVAVAILASPTLASLPMVAHIGRWSASAVASHSPVPPATSLVAAVIVVGIVLRVARVATGLAEQLHAGRSARWGLGPTAPSGLAMLDDPDPLAYALWTPDRRHRRVILSTGLLRLLDSQERAAVVAHERSHLRHNHPMFVAVAALARAVNPFLGSTAVDLRYSLERWADEDAAAATSRPVAASALAKAGLATLAPHRVPTIEMALHGHAVPDRVAALLDEPPHHRPWAWALVATALVAAGACLWATHDAELFFEALRRP
ncbi:MAG: M56 family metallopeptidase [Acidimicrobiales bacterium]